MIPLLLCTAIVLSCAKSLLMRGVSGSVSQKRTFWGVNAVIFAVALAVLALFVLAKGEALSLSSATAGMAVLFSLCTAAGQVLYICAQARGPVSLNTFLYSCGFVIPAVYGIVSDAASVSVYRIVGLALLVAVLYVYIWPRKQRVDPVWLACILTATLMSGLLAILQRLHQTSPAAHEADGFLLTAFAGCVLLSFVLYLFYRCRRSEDSSAVEPVCGKKVLIPVVTGLDIALLNRVNLYLAGALPSIVFYPVFNGAVTLLTSVIAMALFKEKINLRQGLCLAAGIVAILLLNME